MIKDCPFCDGKIKIIEKKVVMEMPNPGQIVVETKCGECQKCGEEFFDEKMSKTFAKEADSAIKRSKKEKPIHIHTGSILI